MFFAELWNGLLELIAQFVIPDWGAIIALLPILIIFVVVAVLLWVFLRLWHAPKARAGQEPDRAEDPGRHPHARTVVRADPRLVRRLHAVPRVSSSVACILILGGDHPRDHAAVLAGRGDAHLRPRSGGAAPPLPAVVHDGPPPGVHMPGPSFRPFLGAVGATMLMLGLVFGEWLLVAGVIALVVTLFGWLVDARKEYGKIVEADGPVTSRTSRRRGRRRCSWSGLLVLLIGAAVIQLGWVPPRDANGGTGSTPAAAPGSGAPLRASRRPRRRGPTADIVLTALNIAFDTKTITGPADVPFTIALVNKDAGTPHNVEFKGPDGAERLEGRDLHGVETRVYDVGALPAGDYTFLCTVHPTMTGTATLK